jgi:uncharacterized protein YggU (UPF0235/DUF167 family)
LKYHVKVRFGAEALEERDGEIIMGISSKPEHGRASKELISKLAAYFDVSPSKVKIISGIKI